MSQNKNIHALIIILIVLLFIIAVTRFVYEVNLSRQAQLEATSTAARSGLVVEKAPAQASSSLSTSASLAKIAGASALTPASTSASTTFQSAQ